VDNGVTASPTSGMSISSRPRSTTSAPCSIGQPSATPSVASPLAASLEGFWLVREPSEGASRLEALLLGAIESEHASRPVRQWENDREELEGLVLGVDGPEFARARTEGRLLSIAEAGGLDARQLAGSHPSCKVDDGTEQTP
jgi:hypothetical protein